MAKKIDIKGEFETIDAIQELFETLSKDAKEYLKSLLYTENIIIYCSNRECLEVVATQEKGLDGIEFFDVDYNYHHCEECNIYLCRKCSKEKNWCGDCGKCSDCIVICEEDEDYCTNCTSNCDCNRCNPINTN
jgi:hypothetical protein